jgi:predicted regulator of Ras-like GTPase activity (Roadblock/LC7/MglB family)
MFKETLQAVIERTDGSIGALIMGTDGIAVEKVLMPEGVDSNLDVAAAELTSLVRNAQRTSDDVGLGALHEMVIACENYTLIMRLVSREYFLILAVRSDANFGRGRFELRKAELILAKEFAL